MSTELKIPSVGESITEVQISEWLKAEGDVVQQDEAVAVIDSEKSTFELPAPQTGRLSKILHQAGETVKVGTVVARLDPAETTPPKSSAENSAPTGGKAALNPPTPALDVEAKDSKAGKKPSRQSAKIQKDEAPAAPLPAAAADSPKEPPTVRTHFPELNQKPSTAGGPEQDVVPMTMLRRTAARRLVEAQQTMAMLTTFNEADLSSVQALRKDYQEMFEKKHQVKLGLMSFFIKAAVDALKQFPKLNAEIRDNDIVYHRSFDIGVAVATERGLVVPVLRQAERLSFAELEKAIGDFGRRGKDGQLKPDDLTGGTFTITNGGVFGSLLSTPIINPPQTGILGLHTIQERPIALQGQVVIRPMMYLALTYDHRLVDGRDAVLFLRRIKQAIETPARLLLEV